MLWECWQQSQAFRCRPRELFGLIDSVDPWLGRMIDRAVWRWGTFIQGKIDERVERPRKKQANKNELVEKYSPDQIHNMIYGKIKTIEELEADAAEARAVQSGQVNPYEIEAEEDYIPPSWRGKRVEHSPTHVTN